MKKGQGGGGGGPEIPGGNIAEHACHFCAKWWQHKCKGWDEEEPTRHGELGKKNVWGLILVHGQPNISKEISLRFRNNQLS